MWYTVDGLLGSCLGIRLWLKEFGCFVFVNELVDVDCVECFDHVESSEDCSMSGCFFVKPMIMV